MTTEAENQMITVCDKCLQASCWQGAYMCWEWKGAGKVQKTINELKALDLEHPTWWVSDEDLGRGKGRRI